MAEYGHNSPKAMHIFAEANKLIFADRAAFMADTAFVQVPLEGLTSKAYAKTLAAKINPDKIMQEVLPGDPWKFQNEQKRARVGGMGSEQMSTSSFSTVDAAGNIVASTNTINYFCGSGVMVPEFGFLLNNEMDDFSVKPGVANVFGLIGGEANAIAPGKRPLSSMMPTMVLKDGQPWMVTGSPGGARIITTVLQTLVNAIDFDMNPHENAATPRIHHQWQPDVLRIEKGFSPDTLQILERLGYDIELKASMGKTQTIQINESGLSGYSDPRNPDGATLGY